MMHRILVLTALLTLATFARAEFPTSQPYHGVTYSHVAIDDPKLPQSIYIITVDLRDPNVKVRLSPGGEDPDGSAGEWQTTLMTVRDVAKREHFDVAVNASFFEITRPKGAGEIAEETSEKAAAASGKATPAPTAPTTNVGYRAGVWSKSVGWSMTDGKLWSPERNAGFATFWIDSRGHGHMGDPKNVPPDAKQLVQGNVWLVRDGKAVEPKGNAKVRHPRTVLGLDASGTKLTILTVDGRRPGVAMGMNGPEMAEQMIRLGCKNAINLDGGGSTTLVMRDPESDQIKVINQPSDKRERPVANVIGVTVGR
jgi:exopolysaccharide biosynthesis protein